MQGGMSQHMARKQYLMLGAMAILHFIVMFVLMYVMVDGFSDVYPNANQVYMAGLMTSPMILIELSLMGMMYPNKKLNIAILAGSALALILFFTAIREQTAIGDTQFLKSMIPHHSGAILMCRKATITDPEIKDLCKRINESQRSEIDEMNALLERGMR